MSMTQFQSLLSKSTTIIAPDGTIIAKPKTIHIDRYLPDSNVTIRQETIDLPSEHNLSKTILFIGTTGSGKTTLLNSMINYLYNVEQDEMYRFRLVFNDENTQFITEYRLNGARTPYHLTIVDTPGFGSTNNKRDIEMWMIDRLHRDLKLDAICLIVKGTETRLSIALINEFKQLLAFVDKFNSKLFVLLTFCDASPAPAYQTIIDCLPTINQHQFIQFNNSAFTRAGPHMSEIQKLFWKLGMNNFDRLFHQLDDKKTIIIDRSEGDERKRLITTPIDNEVVKRQRSSPNLITNQNRLENNNIDLCTSILAKQLLLTGRTLPQQSTNDTKLIMIPKKIEKLNVIDNKFRTFQIGSIQHKPTEHNKSLLLIGSTGSGKSALINSIANYLYEIDIIDRIRIRVIADDDKQTKSIVNYEFNGTRLTYQLNIIDTPGLDGNGSTFELIRNLIQNNNNEKITIDAIGFVIKGTESRLTLQIHNELKQITQFISTIPIIVLLTFCDASEPPAMRMINDYDICHRSRIYKINNSAFFQTTEPKELQKYFWKIGINSFRLLFDQLDKFGNAINNEQRQLNKYKQILVHPIDDKKSIRLNQNKPIIDQVYSHSIHDDQMRKIREERLTIIKETNNYRYSNSIQNHVHSQQQTTTKLATTDQSSINANRSTTSFDSRSNTARSSHHQRFVTAIDLIETKQLIFDNLSESTQCYYIPSASINENRNEIVIGTDRNHNIERRTILLMGESGSGKSALLNSIANYVYGVKINDGYRIRLTESTTTTVGNGATRQVSMYTLLGSRTNYHLSIVDTPGFVGVTDIHPFNSIIDWLNMQLRSDAHFTITAICLVIKANDNLATSRNVSNLRKIIALASATKLPIIPIFTFSDTTTTLSAIDTINHNIHYDFSMQINNRPFIQISNDYRYDKMYTYLWNKTVDQFAKFFPYLFALKPSKLRIDSIRSLLDNYQSITTIADEQQSNKTGSGRFIRKNPSSSKRDSSNHNSNEKRRIRNELRKCEPRLNLYSQNLHIMSQELLAIDHNLHKINRRQSFVYTIAYDQNTMINVKESSNQIYDRYGSKSKNNRRNLIIDTIITNFETNLVNLSQNITNEFQIILEHYAMLEVLSTRSYDIERSESYRLEEDLMRRIAEIGNRLNAIRYRWWQWQQQSRQSRNNSLICCLYPQVPIAQTGDFYLDYFASRTAAIDEEAYEKSDKYQSDQKEPTSRVLADKNNQVRKSRNTNRSSTTSSWLWPKQNSMTNNSRQRRSTSNRSRHKYSSTNSRQHVDDRSPLLDNIYIPHGGRLKK